MSRCEEIQKELDAYLKNEIEESNRADIKNHLVQCRHCSTILDQLKRLSHLLQSWPAPEPSSIIYEKLKARIDDQQSFWSRIFISSLAKKFTLQLAEVAVIVGLTLLISNWINKSGSESGDQATIINFYLKEHQNIITQNISADISELRAARMELNRNDILYYEFLDQFPPYSQPGIILRPPVIQEKTSLTKDPVIVKGKDITLSEAENEINFNFIAPPNFHPGYLLENIRKIEERNTLHLLYNNGVNKISLFQQPVKEEPSLAARDFREYAIYQNQGQMGGTILAWSDNVISFVLISNAELTQLMDISQHINTINRRE